jgi:hypothetical protein
MALSIVLFAFAAVPAGNWLKIHWRSAPLGSLLLSICASSIFVMICAQLVVFHARLELSPNIRPPGPISDCAGKTGDAIANGDGNAVSTGNCGSASTHDSTKGARK